MTKVIYIDELFLLNLIFDYLLLLATAKICGATGKRVRLIAAAGAGALYAVLSVVPGLAFLAHPAAALASGAAMLLIAFGFRRRFMKLALVFFAVSAAGAGAVTAVALMGGAVRINLRVLAVSFIICYIAVTLVFRRAARDGQRYAALTLRHGEREVTLRALRDNGHSLRDPVSSLPVAIISARDAARLFPDSCENVLRSGASPADALVKLSAAEPDIRFRLIPYNAVGGGGLLIAFRPDGSAVDGVSRDMLVAVSPNEVADNATYDALIQTENK